MEVFIADEILNCGRGQKRESEINPITTKGITKFPMSAVLDAEV
jgi:hypothetical protein